MKLNKISSFFFLSFFIVLSYQCETKKHLDSEIGKKHSDSLEKLELKISPFAKKREYDSAIYYSKKLLELSKKNSDSSYIAKSEWRLGYYYKYSNNLLEAFEHFNNSYNVYLKVNDSLAATKKLLSMANIQKSIGDYGAGQVTALDALKYLEKKGDKKIISGLYHNISIILKEQGKYDEALQWNNKAFLLYDKANKESIKTLAKLKITKANILSKQGKYNDAVNIYNNLLKNEKIINDDIEHARVLDNLGYTKFQQHGENKESDSLLQTALSIRNQLKDISGLIASNIHLTQFYFNNDKNKALIYAENAYKNAKLMSSKVSTLEALDYIIDLKENSKKEAIEYKETYKSLEKLRQNIRSVYQTAKYENDKLREEKLLLENTSIKNQNQRNVFIALGLIILLISGFLYFNLKSKHKQDTIQKIYNTETRISKKVHDEVANDIYLVMTKLQNNTNGNKETLDDLEDIYTKTRDISKENSTVDFNGAYEEALNDLLLSYKNDNVNIITKNISKINWNTISNTKKTTIHRVLQELMTNMKKHSDASVVILTFSILKNKIVINYKDNGIGCDLKKQNGLQNVENRIHTINGTINFDSQINSGFKATIIV